LEWSETTIVLVEISAGGKTGLGYSYADAATAHLIHHTLNPKIKSGDAFAIGELWQKMAIAVRNLGRSGSPTVASV